MAFKIWDWKTKPELTGKLVAKLNSIPPWGKRLYGFELEDGEIWYSWGYKELHSTLAHSPFLTKVKIKFLGKGRAAPEDKFDVFLFDTKILALPDKTKKKYREDKKAPPSAL